MGKNRFSGVTRWMAVMSIGGILIGAMGYLASEWVVESVDNTLAHPVAPVVVATAALLVAPALASLVALYRVKTAGHSNHVTEAAIGSLVGSVLYVIASLLVIGMDGPSLFDVVSIAGLIALTSVLSGTATAAAFSRLYGDVTEEDATEEEAAPMELPAVSDSAN